MVDHGLHTAQLPRSNMFIFTDQERTGRNIAEVVRDWMHNLVGAGTISPPPGGPKYLAQGLHDI